jgi:hypothetical protein
MMDNQDDEPEDEDVEAEVEVEAQIASPSSPNLRDSTTNYDIVNLTHEEYIWWDLMTQLIHSSTLYTPLSHLPEAPKEVTSQTRTLGFLDVQHHMLSWMWMDEKRDMYTKQKKMYEVMMRKANTPNFSLENRDHMMTRFWKGDDYDSHDQVFYKKNTST